MFPLTVVVQKIAAEAAEALGTNPDRFGRDLPGRDAAWAVIRSDRAGRRRRDRASDVRRCTPFLT